MPKISLLAAVIISAMPTGYRRAGFAFEKGENQLEINETQLGQIKQDTNLRLASAEPIEPSSGNESQEIVNSHLDKKDITIDDSVFDKAPPELMHFIITLHLLNSETALTKAPKCDDLACEFIDENNKSKQVKPTAVERDTAWAWYQDNVVKSSKNKGA